MSTKGSGRPITYEDVKDLLSIQDDMQWDGNGIYPPYELRTNGIYAKPAYRIPELTQDELEALRPWFPPDSDGIYDVPVCRLPSEAEDFIEFIRGADLLDRVINLDGDFVDLWRKLGLPEEIDASTENHLCEDPALLATPDIAKAFAHLHRWDEDGWIKNLGDPAKWMQPALITRRPKPMPSLWNPVKLALELMKFDKTVTHKEITRRFDARPKLEHWRDAWQSYAEAFKDPTD